MRKIIWVVLSMFLTSTLSAEPFRILGARALGMGGAFVAVAGDTPSTSDALTQYWNPAALAMHKGLDIEIPFTAGVETTGGLLEYVDEISDSAEQFTSINDAQEDGSFIDLEQIKAFTVAIKNLDSMNDPGLGLIADVGGGINGAYGKFAISANNFTSLGISPTVDMNSLFLGAGSSLSPVKKALQAVAGYDGIDFTELPNISGDDITQADIDNATSDPGSRNGDTRLSDSSSDLANLIDLMATEAGVEIGEETFGYTADDIANAIINYSYDSGVSADDIVSSIDTINEYYPLIEDLISGGGTGSFSNNDSNVTVHGISYNEVSLGYGRSLEFADEALKNLYVGINAKFIQGTVGYVKQRVFDEDAIESSSILDDFNDNIKTSVNVAADIGLLYDTKIRIKKDIKTRIGLLMRNINTPSFTQPQAAKDEGYGDYKIDPQMRAGVAFWPMKNLILSCDYDLKDNSTPIEGYNSRMFGAGLELCAPNKPTHNIAVRLGLLKNMANSSAAMAYTGGLGFNIYHFILDLSGAISSKTVKIEDGTEIPASAYVMLSMGMNF